MNGKKISLKWIASVIVMLALIVGLGVWAVFTINAKSLEKMFTLAVTDAVTADADEIAHLVELEKSDQLTTWDETDRVLLLSWHRYPDSYKQGEEIELSYGEIWTFTDKEIALWYSLNKDGVNNWPLRLEQLIGLPPNGGYTHVTAFWVYPENVVRPAYVTDITKQMQLEFSADVTPEFKDWFDGNIAYSYEESAYPWTRLGYTYDWADNGVEYGLTEFLVEKDAPVLIEFTKTTGDFIKWLDQGALVA